MLLAGRVRKQPEESVIAEVLQKHFKRSICLDRLFGDDSVYVKDVRDQVQGLHSSLPQ